MLKKINDGYKTVKLDFRIGVQKIPTSKLKTNEHIEIEGNKTEIIKNQQTHIQYGKKIKAKQ